MHTRLVTARLPRGPPPPSPLPPPAQRILSVTYSFPSDLRLSDSCKDLISSMLVAGGWARRAHLHLQSYVMIHMAWLSSMLVAGGPGARIPTYIKPIRRFRYRITVYIHPMKRLQYYILVT